MVKWPGGNFPGSAMPVPPILLRWVYVVRVAVAGAIYLSAAFKFNVAAPLDLLVTSFLLARGSCCSSGCSRWSGP